MDKKNVILFVLLVVTLSMAQEPKRAAPGKAVSAEFAKAVNLAFVAIGNSDNIDPNYQDDIIRTAVNNADAVAFRSRRLA